MYVEFILPNRNYNTIVRTKHIIATYKYFRLKIMTSNKKRNKYLRRCPTGNDFLGKLPETWCESFNNSGQKHMDSGYM